MSSAASAFRNPFEMTNHSCTSHVSTTMRCLVYRVRQTHVLIATIRRCLVITLTGCIGWSCYPAIGTDGTVYIRSSDGAVYAIK
jgi:hypothetical protein